jgi:Mce-associated membrane protein
MTPARSGDTDGKTEEPEGESAAVVVRTDTASELDAAEAEAIEPKVKKPEDIDSDADAGQPEAAVSDAAHVAQQSAPSKPAKAKLRFRVPWTRSYGDDGERAGHDLPEPSGDEATPRSGDAEDRSTQGDDETVEGQPEEPSDATAPAESAEPAKDRRRMSWSYLLVYAGLPALAFVLAGAAVFFKWQSSSVSADQTARVESVAAAKDATIAMLSYKSDTVEKDLDAAKSRLTGAFKESYLQLTNDVVIPGAKKAHVSTTATVPGAASVSANPSHAVVLLFVNQTAVIDKDPPADTESSVRVTLEKVGGRWLISGFEPV